MPPQSLLLDQLDGHGLNLLAPLFRSSRLWWLLLPASMQSKILEVNEMNLKERIKRHEGKRNKPYEDSEGVLTVGYGRNLRDVPFTDHEIDVLFATDFERALLGARSFNVYQDLNDVRRGILVEMVFQMGRAGVWKFKKFLKAARAKDWEGAYTELLDSQWAKQTPARAQELANLFRRGKHE